MAEVVWIYFQELAQLAGLASWNASKTYSNKSEFDLGNATSKALDNVVDNILDTDIGYCLSPATNGGVSGGVYTGISVNDVVKTAEGAYLVQQTNAVYAQNSLYNTIDEMLTASGLRISNKDEVVLKVAREMIGNVSLDDIKTVYKVNNFIKALPDGSLKSYITQQMAQTMLDAMAMCQVLPSIRLNPAGVDTEVDLSDKPSPANGAITVFNRAVSANAGDIEWTEGRLACQSKLYMILDAIVASYGTDGYFCMSQLSGGTYQGSEKISLQVWGAPHIARAKFTTKTASGGNGAIDTGSGSWLTSLLSTVYYLYYEGGEVKLATSFNVALATVCGFLSGAYAIVSNILADVVYPDGITYEQDGYIVPSLENHALVDVYPAWLANAISLGGYDVDTDTASGVRAIPIAGVIAGTQTAVQAGALTAERARIIGESVTGIEFTDITGEKVLPIDTEPKPSPTPVPVPVPTLGTAKRMYTVHKLTDAQLQALGGYLWSGSFISLIEHMFTEPSSAIIGLHTLWHNGSLPLGGSENIKLGSVDSGCTGTLVTNQFTEFSCGSVTIPEYYGNVTDYEPYTSVQLYLPFIGFVSLNANEVMASTIEVKYGIDIFTGVCLARVFVTRDGVTQELYNFSGCCSVQQPITGANYSNTITGVIGGIVGGFATGNVAGAVAGGLEGAMANKPSYERSGSLGSNSGALAYKKPFILINRPLAFNASNYSYYYGHPTNWTVTLSEVHGYTRVKDIHLSTATCTEIEKEEIVSLLKQGVIL